MITIDEFLRLACDDCYEVSIYDCNRCVELYNNKEVSWLRLNLPDRVLYSEIESWDIDFFTKNFCLNICLQ